MIEVIPNWHPVFVHFPIAFTAVAAAFVATGSGQNLLAAIESNGQDAKGA